MNQCLSNIMQVYCRRTSGPTRRSTKGQWTPEEVNLLIKEQTITKTRKFIVRYLKKHLMTKAAIVPWALYILFSRKWVLVI